MEEHCLLSTVALATHQCCSGNSLGFSGRINEEENSSRGVVLLSLRFLGGSCFFVPPSWETACSYRCSISRSKQSILNSIWTQGKTGTEREKGQFVNFSPGRYFLEKKTMHFVWLYWVVEQRYFPKEKHEQSSCDFLELLNIHSLHRRQRTLIF